MPVFVNYLLASSGVCVSALTGAVACGFYILPIGKIPTINFETLGLTGKPNLFLVCPPNTCSATPSILSPTYGMSVEELRLRWQHHLAEMPGVRQIEAHGDGWQFTYVERSRLMGYPDLITIRYFPLEANTSTLALYSRSLYGYSDLGVNQERIEQWLASFKN